MCIIIDHCPGQEALDIQELSNSIDLIDGYKQFINLSAKDELVRFHTNSRWCLTIFFLKNKSLSPVTELLLAESPEQVIMQLPGYSDVSDKNLFDFNEFEINLNNCSNSSLTESSNMEKEASQPTSTKWRGKEPFFLYHFFTKLRTLAGQRIAGLPWASYKPQHSHCHSRHQTIMGNNFLLANECI